MRAYTTVRIREETLRMIEELQYIFKSLGYPYSKTFIVHFCVREAYERLKKEVTYS